MQSFINFAFSAFLSVFDFPLFPVIAVAIAFFAIIASIRLFFSR